MGISPLTECSFKLFDSTVLWGIHLVRKTALAIAPNPRLIAGVV